MRRLSRRQTTLFVRSIKSKLLKLIKPNTDIKIRHYDRTTKLKMNRHPDSDWYVKPLIIKEGDKVLVKRDESKKTNDIAYNTTPSIEFDKKGSILTAEAQKVS